MNKYEFSWLSTKDNDPLAQTLHHNTTFAENEQEATDYVTKVIREWLYKFNHEHPDMSGHMEDLTLVSTKDVPYLP
jgi:hypothetical protein